MHKETIKLNTVTTLRFRIELFISKLGPWYTIENMFGLDFDYDFVQDNFSRVVSSTHGLGLTKGFALTKEQIPLFHRLHHIMNSADFFHLSEDDCWLEISEIIGHMFVPQFNRSVKLKQALITQYTTETYDSDGHKEGSTIDQTQYMHFDDTPWDVQVKIWDKFEPERKLHFYQGELLIGEAIERAYFKRDDAFYRKRCEQEWENYLPFSLHKLCNFS